jgi:hypothetical protein
MPSKKFLKKSRLFREHIQNGRIRSNDAEFYVDFKKRSLVTKYTYKMFFQMNFHFEFKS